MSNLQSFDPDQKQPLVLAPGAVARLHNILKKEEDSDVAFRVYVTGGGCSGFQYGFKLDKHQLDEDTCIQQDGITVLIDSLSIQYIEGAQVDFQESLTGSSFSVVNPNASIQCSCGSSFSI